MDLPKKTFLKEKYLCKDEKHRRAFRIKGYSNTIFVMYKRCITKAVDIPPVLQKRISRKKKTKVGGSDPISIEYQKTIELYPEEISLLLSELSKSTKLELNKKEISEISEISSDIKNNTQVSEFVSLCKKTFILNALMTHKGFIDDFTDFTDYNNNSYINKYYN